MSSNNKRCSSGTPPTTRTQSLSSLKQLSTLSRSKTCGMTGITSLKSKPERLQPIVTNKNSHLNDETILDDINCLHPAMVNELCLHARGFSTIPNLSQFSKLQILDLSCNNLTRIENLRNLSNLRELKLYGNKLERIENLEWYFKYKFSSLELARNLSFPKLVIRIRFFSLTQLQILQLQYNDIQTIGLSLVYLTRLQSLRIDSNKLSIIRSDEVLKLVQLRILDVSDCSIENLDFINSLSSLTEFRASHCCLKILPNQFRHLRNLIDLDLSNNQLTNITSLKILTSLRILHLGNNNIKDLQIISFLIHLNELDLSYNQIHLIPNSFEKLIDLQYLNLSNNQINTWKNIDVLPRMNSLFILNINGNSFLSQIENYIEKLSQFCPLLEIIDDISLRNDHSKITENESYEQLMNIDKELKEVDQKLERSIAAVEEQFDTILKDLQKLNQPNEELITNNSTESKNTNQKSKYRLFQALTFSEENYQ